MTDAPRPDDHAAAPPDEPTPSGEAAPNGPAAPDASLEPVVPIPPAMAGGSGPRSLAAGVALGLVGFVATLVLLGGLTSLLGRSEARGVTDAPPSPTAAASSVASQPPPSGSAAAGSPSATPSGDPVLVGAGDIADCALDGDSKTADLLDTLPGTVFTTGDNVYPDGHPDRYRDCYGPTWGRHLARTRPAPGNHDWATGDLAGYLGYFGATAAPAGTSWYSYDLGTWHVIVLDSDCEAVGGCGPESAQGRWLAADLAASDARCTVAIWHHPRFSSGVHGNDTAVAPFWRALYDDGADLIVNGHDHDYERFAPQDPDGRADLERGIREFVVGTGGAALRAFPNSAANSQIRVAAYHGVLRLVLHPASYEWSFIPASSPFRDSGKRACH